MNAHFAMPRRILPLLLALCGAAQSAAAPGYDFAYRVSGDRRVAPVQVFDDGRDTYLQFRAGQTVPAIFEAGPGGERLASHAMSGAYVTVAGTAARLVLRIGDVAADAQYLGSSPRAGLAIPDHAGPIAAGRADQTAAVAFGVSSSGMPSSGPSTLFAAAPPRAPFTAAPADRNMRSLLQRWAREAGWTFNAEHWAVDVDIPLAGSASFDGDFKGAVRQLLASTELSPRPLQPCFYSNRVLRVVPLVQACDRVRAAASPR
ncbi:TcpQ domain-containing protein [Pigmentiphaga soli]|uniref:TcpQ domain-containing protein n=1 Tax=Pigmentiphaga soli TaxID=1007095 RepID=A0ABP8GEM0_9BURK